MYVIGDATHLQSVKISGAPVEDGATLVYDSGNNQWVYAKAGSALSGYSGFSGFSGSGESGYSGFSGSIATSGSIIQVVSTGLDTTIDFTATSWTTLSGLSVNITPKASGNKIFCTASLTASSNTNFFFLQLVRGSTAIGIGSAQGSRSQAGAVIFTYESAASVRNPTLACLDSPNTTSQVTYSVQGRMLGTGSDRGYINRDPAYTDNAGYATYYSSITVFEVSA